MEPQSTYFESDSIRLQERKKRLHIARRIDNYRCDFLLKNLNDYMQAVSNGTEEAWWNDFLQRYIACYPDSVLNERLYGTPLQRWSVQSLKQQLETWMNYHGSQPALEDGSHALGRHLYATLVRSQGSLDQYEQVSDGKNTNISNDFADFINATSTDVETGCWGGLDTDGMGRGPDEHAKEQIGLLARLEKEKEELHHMAIEAWAIDIYLKKGDVVSGY
ncbi:hypothetical protein ARMSODRAFT_980415 [Armillaria solidipes]|uniref:Uncharacterized protein n=1 Tax=Armillaria solidipes TaxID=1076256 RepID=A0A2H3BG11_9AGAR|nr:hypothetical protein ARMSODRAFT_980415 [Armillaria solidipes]